jgi:hypothetical protein
MSRCCDIGQKANGPECDACREFPFPLPSYHAHFPEWPKHRMERGVN